MAAADGDSVATPPSGFAAAAGPATTPPTGYGPAATPGYSPAAGYGPPPGHGTQGGQGYGPPPGYGPQGAQGYAPPGGPGYAPPGGPGYASPGGPGYPPPGGAGYASPDGPGYASPGGPGYPPLGGPGNAPPGYPPQAAVDYGPPQGFGPPPGYGPPGFDTAPRPGIIPLRPLGFGDFFSGAFGYIRANPASTLLPALVVAAITQLVQLVVQAAFGVSGTPTTLNGTAGYALTSFAASAIDLVVGLVLGAALTGVLITVLRGAVIGRRTDLGAAWRAVRPRVAGLIGVALLSFVIVVVFLMVGFGLAVGLGFGIGGGGGAAVGVLLGLATFVFLIYLSVLLSLAAPAYVMEDIGVLAALRRSRDLVRGVWWQVFAVLLVALLAFSVIGGVLGAIGGGFGVASSITPGSVTPPVPGVGFMIAIAVVVVIITTFATPFIYGVIGLLYVDQRIRRERFDLQLAGWAAQR